MPSGQGKHFSRSTHESISVLTQLRLQLPQGASTEVQLIAATVFATLNESWDKFKAENNL